MSIQYQKKWLELAHDKNAYLYPTMLYWWCAQYAAKKVGVEDGIIGCWYKDNSFSYLTNEGSLAVPGRKILERLEQNDILLKKIELVNKKEVPMMLEAAEKLSGDLSALSGQELRARWQDWLKKFISMMTYSVMATAAEMEIPLLSNRVEQIISRKLGKGNEKIGEYFQLLSSSPRETVILREEKALLKLRLKQLRYELSKKDVADHLKKYAWIGYGYNGPAWGVKDIRQRLSLLPAKKVTVTELLAVKGKSANRLSKKQENMEQELGLNVQEKRVIHALRTLGFWKFERKFLNQKAHLLMDDFIQELAKRNHLSRVQASMISPKEMKDALLKNNISAELMNERIRESVVLFKGTDYQVLSGNNVKRISQDISRSLCVDPKIKVLYGNTAYPGLVKGVVKRIDEVLDLPKMKKGDILVSTSTNPQVVPAMQKAGAIITDSGGITCHAAIVARELKVPCVIGTKVATRVLKDGDLVEVDANRGIIKKLNK
ncbi:MAG: PEP-utilizing enzyme [Patescibacteria group bacterium]|jgi:phosphohistidine swiveling domain-containing protein